MQKTITTLEQLEKEKEKLKMTMTVTRDAFSKSIGTNRKELKDFVLKKIAIPVGAVGLGTLAIGHMTKSKKSPKPANNNVGSAMIGGLLPIAINLVQTYMLKKQGDKIEKEL